MTRYTQEDYNIAMKLCMGVSGLRTVEEIAQFVHDTAAAAALQKLMDERDRWMAYTKLYETSIDAYQERAEAAERVLQQWIERTNEANSRAEAAEKDRDSYKRTTEEYSARKDAAESRLAECVREVRAEMKQGGAVKNYYLNPILDKYASSTTPSPVVPDKPEHPDTVRLRECIKRIRSELHNVGFDCDGDRDFVLGVLATFEAPK